MTTTAINTGINFINSVIEELQQRNDKSKWDKAVTAYAIELVESLDNWSEEPQSVAELREMLLNGATNWIEYSYGGCSLIYNEDIAQRCCTPSELKRVYNKHGELNSHANKCEMWIDVQARALCQAERRIINIAYKYFTA